MNAAIHASFLPHNDPEASLALFVGALGAIRPPTSARARCAGLRSGLPGQPDTSILLAPPTTDPGTTEDDERRVISEIGGRGQLRLDPPGRRGSRRYLRERARPPKKMAVQEPTDQPSGIRDCALRDTAGNLIRMKKIR